MNSAQMGAAVCRSAEVDVTVVVVSDPDDAEQIAGIAANHRRGRCGLPAAGAVNPIPRTAAAVHC